MEALLTLVLRLAVLALVIQKPVEIMELFHLNQQKFNPEQVHKLFAEVIYDDALVPAEYTDIKAISLPSEFGIRLWGHQFL